MFKINQWKPKTCFIEDCSVCLSIQTDFKDSLSVFYSVSFDSAQNSAAILMLLYCSSSLSIVEKLRTSQWTLGLVLHIWLSHVKLSFLYRNMCLCVYVYNMFFSRCYIENQKEYLQYIWSYVHMHVASMIGCPWVVARVLLGKPPRGLPLV